MKENKYWIKMSKNGSFDYVRYDEDFNPSETEIKILEDYFTRRATKEEIEMFDKLYQSDSSCNGEDNV